MDARPKREDAVLNAAQAAAAYGVEVGTLQAWADTGRVRFVVTSSGQRGYLESEIRLLVTGGIPRQRRPV